MQQQIRTYSSSIVFELESAVELKTAELVALQAAAAKEAATSAAAAAEAAATAAAAAAAVSSSSDANDADAAAPPVAAPSPPILHSSATLLVAESDRPAELKLRVKGQMKLIKEINLILFLGHPMCVDKAVLTI